MKKIILSICLLSGIFASAQNEDSKKNTTLYLDASVSVGTNIGLTYEYPKEADSKESYVFKVHYIASKLDGAYTDIDGNGFGLEIGTKKFFSKEAYKGFYGASYATYGNIKFKEENLITNPISGSTEEFEGKYRYFSFFSPEIGYKFLITEKIAINLHVGTSWLIEVKGKGDIDNKAFDNWVLRSGIAIGYNF